VKAIILDLETGTQHEIDGVRSWEFAENNYSCDCNREKDHTPRTKLCESKRYLVVGAEFEEMDDYEYSLRELNEHYPKWLLDWHFPDEKPVFGYRDADAEGENCLNCQNCELYYIETGSGDRFYNCKEVSNSRSYMIDKDHICNRYQGR